MQNNNNHRDIVVTSYNIHKGMSPLNRHVKLREIADALQALKPDILCLQEVQGEHIKRVAKYAHFPQPQHQWVAAFLSHHHSYGKNCQYDNGHHGNAILSHYPLTDQHNVNVSVNRWEKRGILHCEVQPEGWGQAIAVLCAHFNLLEHDRQKQYRETIAYIDKTIPPEQPVILAGDFNDWRQRSLQIMQTHLEMKEVFSVAQQKQPATFPARLPLLSLDRIYVRGLRVESAWVSQGRPWSRLSDHLPISARLSLP